MEGVYPCFREDGDLKAIPRGASLKASKDALNFVCRTVPLAVHDSHFPFCVHPRNHQHAAVVPFQQDDPRNQNRVRCVLGNDRNDRLVVVLLLVRPPGRFRFPFSFPVLLLPFIDTCAQGVGVGG
jgi:hypothetical protein